MLCSSLFVKKQAGTSLNTEYRIVMNKSFLNGHNNEISIQYHTRLKRKKLSILIGQFFINHLNVPQLRVILKSLLGRF